MANRLGSYRVVCFVSSVIDSCERSVAVYCKKCGKELTGNLAFCPYCGATLTQTEAGPVSPKSRLATALFAWFLGMFGAHRFYVGKTGSAAIMLLLCVLGFATIWLFVGLVFLIPVWIWSLVDFIFAVAGSFTDSEGKLIKNW